MAKIYDALRKAEADRQRKVGGGARGERLDWEPETPEPATPSGSVKGFDSFSLNRTGVLMHS